MLVCDVEQRTCSNAHSIGTGGINHCTSELLWTQTCNLIITYPSSLPKK
uniref:Uncharacterized protein n=1 Tax=Rhizophora mucronata TaxID=61149 RepID=A0A2P2QQT3_RHIMU